MKRHVLIYGLVGGALIIILKLTEYRFLVIDHSIEIYGALIAAIFAALGIIWLGLKLTKTHERAVMWAGRKLVERVERNATKEIPVPVSANQPFVPDDRKREDLGITRRELDILELIAQGMSTREIAEKLYVSENTVTATFPGRVYTPQNTSLLWTASA
jgi:NarL family two-component system response regulator LiaR